MKIPLRSRCGPPGPLAAVDVYVDLQMSVQARLSECGIARAIATAFSDLSWPHLDTPLATAPLMSIQRLQFQDLGQIARRGCYVLPGQPILGNVVPKTQDRQSNKM